MTTLETAFIIGVNRGQTIVESARDVPYSLCRLALFTLCSAATWWLKRRQPVSAPLVASRLNGRRRATLSQKFQKTPQFIT
jgi:hypothetical protein